MSALSQPCVITVTGPRENSGPYRMPKLIHEGLEEYIQHGYQPGGFLWSVITNDLCEAVCRADDDSLACLGDIVKYLLNEAPMHSYGSVDHVNLWIHEHEERRAV